MRYKWRTGMWAWVLHRVTGLGITYFILQHIWSVSHLQQGRESFDNLMKLYNLPIFKLGELGLLGILIYHSMNGIRVFLIDFYGGAKYHKQLFWVLTIIGAIMFLAGAYPFVNPLFAGE
ncbi:MAG: succinate dehydrogenase, cytochrome b556 subunit [Candidatus Schekmanbacteria bacterium]|nr:succinate dehydrogenase, cytochrome b556 subunit [Candidatus Schekmanbacteria bacterium]